MTVKRIELLQYTSSKDIVRYHAVSVDENDNLHECMIDSCVYNRAKTQAQHVADACGVKLYDKTCHSD